MGAHRQREFPLPQFRPQFLESVQLRELTRAEPFPGRRRVQIGNSRRLEDPAPARCAECSPAKSRRPRAKHSWSTQ